MSCSATLAATGAPQGNFRLDAIRLIAEIVQGIAVQTGPVRGRRGGGLKIRDLGPDRGLVENGRVMVRHRGLGLVAPAAGEGGGQLAPPEIAFAADLFADFLRTALVAHFHHPGTAARQLAGVIVVIVVEDRILAGAPTGAAQFAVARAVDTPNTVEKDRQDHQDAQYDQNFACAKIHEFLSLYVRVAWCPASAPVGFHRRRPGQSATKPALSVNHFSWQTKRLLKHRKELNQP